MNVTTTLALAQLELRRIFRDRNWLRSQLGLPLLVIPLIFLVLPNLLARGGTTTTSFGNRVALSGQYTAAYANALRNEGYVVTEVKDARAALQDREADVAIVGIKPKVDAQHLGEVSVYVKGSRMASSVTAQRLSASLRDIDIDLLAQAAGVNRGELLLQRPSFMNSDSPGELALGALGFVVISIITMGIANQVGTISTDLTGHAQERGEFVSQLSTPISGLSFYLVRVIPAASTAIIFAVWNLAVFQLVGWIQPHLVSTGFVNGRAINFGSAGFTNPATLAQTVIISLTLALTMSATATTIGIWIRSAKGMNNFYGPFMALVSVVPVGALITDQYFQVSPILMAIPGLNGAVAQLKALYGTLNITQLLIVVGSSLAFTGLMAVLGSHWVRSHART